ncbi:MAG: ATP-binding protein [Deltaproteobacteria bacterium]|nr:ATP-binding protein [Deltaproteobacteria bacterium]
MNNEYNQVRIKSIFISNFRSFAPRNKEEDGMNIDNLSAINVFVGPNGSGKTNFLNALRDCIDWHSFNSQGLCRPESHYYQKDKPVDIIIEFADCYPPFTFHRVAWLEEQKVLPEPMRMPDAEIRKYLKQRIYPIGQPHKFSGFNNIHRDEIDNSPKQDRAYAKICCSWRKICEDAKRMGVKLQKNYPKEPVVKPNSKDYADRFFYDVVDNYGVPILEGSDGIASLLLMIVKIRIREPGSVILIEEPEVSMHPSLQKQFLDYLKHLAEKENYQFLVSTHSPYLMNLAVTEKVDEVAVFRLSKDAKDCTQIKPAENKRAENWEILTDLGHSPADVLQANGIIWVEGPSDLIYVGTWLEKLAPDLRRGKDYEIMWYGGSIFVHLGIEEIQLIEEKLWQNSEGLIDLFNLNPNWAFLVDSDSDKLNHESESVQKSQKTINKAKDKFISQCKEKGKHTWQVDPYIEQCISGREKRPKAAKKVDWAHKYQSKIEKSSDTDCCLTDDAQTEVKELINVIRNWC